MLILEPITESKGVENSDWPGLGHVFTPAPGRSAPQNLMDREVGGLVFRSSVGAGLSQLQEPPPAPTGAAGVRRRSCRGGTALGLQDW